MSVCGKSVLFRTKAAAILLFSQITRYWSINKKSQCGSTANTTKIVSRLAATGRALLFLEGRANTERLGKISSIRPCSGDAKLHNTLSPTATVSSFRRVWHKIILSSYSTAIP